MKSSSSLFPGKTCSGFTLVELLTVIVIISIISTVAFVAFGSLGKADNFNSATSTISTLLEQARAYAMANNTYVFVGIEETDVSQPVNGPQNTGPGFIGRVAIQAFAAQDGTMNLAASNLTAINRMQILNNLDLPASLTVNSGTLPNRPPSPDYYFGATSFPTVPAASAITSRTFTFTKIIAFDALGIVHLPALTPSSGFQYIEIDAQPTNGTVVSPTATNVSAIEIDATTGAISIYRS